MTINSMYFDKIFNLTLKFINSNSADKIMNLNFIIEINFQLNCSIKE